MSLLVAEVCAELRFSAPDLLLKLQPEVLLSAADLIFERGGEFSRSFRQLLFHELGHLFCAKHVSDDSAVMNTFAGSVKFLEETAGNMRESILAKNKRGACPTVDAYRARRAMAVYPQIARRSSVGGHRDDSHSHHAHTHGHTAQRTSSRPPMRWA